MKCVRLVDNSAILRLRDYNAAKLVKKEKAVYVCKGIWKAYRKSLQENK